ncbi:MAG: DUF58 domain-containing protein [Acidobacteriota bacterium]
MPLTREMFRAIRRIEIRTRRLVDQGLAGGYHSVFKGRGMEFSEVREYAPGDDVRTIDWNVTARTGRPFVKKFVEERELTVMLAVDRSASGAFGSGSRWKNEVAAEVGAVLAYSAIRNNDRVGLLVFTDQVEMFIPPRKGRNHVLRVIREILAFEPRRAGTHIAAALDFLNRALVKRSVVFLLSDFRDKGYDRPLSIASRRHDVIAISIDDPRERALPAVGLLSVRDAETGQTVLLDTSRRSVRDAYARRDQELRAGRTRLFRRIGLDEIPVTTDRAFDRALVSFFDSRARRMA